MSFKEKIKELRLDNNLSQKKLAEALSLSQSCITKLEAGTREPTGSTLSAYSQFFDVSVDYLIGNEEITPFRPEKSDLKLSKEELDLIKFYRAIDKPSKLAIFTTAKSFYNQLPKEKRLSDSI